MNIFALQVKLDYSTWCTTRAWLASFLACWPSSTRQWMKNAQSSQERPAYWKEIQVHEDRLVHSVAFFLLLLSCFFSSQVLAWTETVLNNCSVCRSGIQSDFWTFCGSWFVSRFSINTICTTVSLPSRMQKKWCITQLTCTSTWCSWDWLTLWCWQAVIMQSAYSQ